jgi:hypothetical protein
MRPDLKPEYLNKPDDEKMYEQYMEILKDNMDREKRAAHRTSYNFSSQVEKEEANIPVGKHCVRSLYQV